MGLLSAGVLNVNNMRDIVNDMASGKRTLVVRMGSANARAYHTLLITGGVLGFVGFGLLADLGWSDVGSFAAQPEPRSVGAAHR